MAIKVIFCVGFCCALMTPAVQVFGQTSQAIASQNEQAPDATTQLETVMVTAQRVTENLESVPISVQALSFDTLKQFGVESSADLAAAVPGLTFGQNGNAGTPFIRGVGNDNPWPDESAVAIYVDGIYRPTADADLFALNNVQQVEVLKGPQGTLFGRNATGGVINITTRDPSAEPAAEASAGYGNYGTAQARVYASTPIADGLSANIAGYYLDQSQGWGRNVFDGDPAYKQGNAAMQTKWRLDLESTTITLIGDWERSRNENGLAAAAKGNSTYTGLPLFVGDYNINVNFVPYGVTNQGGVGLLANHDFGWAALHYIGSYRSASTEQVNDFDYTPTNAQNFTNHEAEHFITQELQLLSATSSRISWIGGIYYLGGDSDVYNPGFALFFPTPAVDITTQIKTTSYSGFGQATVPLNDNTRLTGGVRYTSDEKTGSGGTYTPTGDLLSFAAGSHKWDAATWRASLDHHFTDDLMAYASYNRGFKSGVFNEITFNPTPVAPETVDAYEIGAKFGASAVTVNAAIYYNKFDNIQTQAVVTNPVTGAFQSELVNAARATIKGVDLALDAVPIRDLRLSANVAYTHGVYTSFPNAPFSTLLPNGGYQSGATGDASGEAIDRTPDVAIGLSATDTLRTAAAGNFLIRGSYSYSSSYWFQPYHVIQQPVLNMINASLEWRPPSDRFGIQVWGKNLTNQISYLNGNTIASGAIYQPGAPRTYGITVNARL